VVDQLINDIRLDEYTADFRILGVVMPFTRGDVISNGEFQIKAFGGASTTWVPAPGNIFLYGLDMASSRPNDVIPLMA
jgi:hypothetical protein